MNKNALKNIIYSIVLLLVMFLVYLYRQNQPLPTKSGNTDTKTVLSGTTMGTSYRIVYLDEQRRDLQDGIDSLLNVFNQSLSTYIPDSEISRFNRSDTLVFELPYFYPVLSVSKEVFEATDGAFDPTVGPLVNTWGFGPEGAERKDSLGIQQLLQRVGFDKVQFDQHAVVKLQSDLYLDFSAIAKGYGVDVVAQYLSERGIAHYLVEIGGELVAKGTNDAGEIWKVGITQPDEEGQANELYSIVALDNKGMATSGNYRNFYEQDGQKLSHTISPFTGYPVVHGLLSATVLADDCMTADAYATAMMVVGTEASIALQQKVPGLEIFLIYNDGEGKLQSYASEGLKPYLSFPQRNP
ncbi:MAG: FAD:protein FMN transferase [Lunatimonas sp.]|uniref:FAD:protein FMN transferase n=1 Tax=Lunatimonas sp. TaxID=2060141 RepID=UPI00263B0769|nr:FAD:protein FMN transferase [Lunatimonas sp.]MCC5937788.1 FAD:protein FMN transferase [Lunatimonas sp.]